MKTIILPGYSPKNKKWAEDVEKTFVDAGLDTVVHEWSHWMNGQKFNLKKEKDKILAFIGKDKVNILAKSVGTIVLMSLTPNIKSQINKVILCGIPIDPIRYVKGVKLIGFNKLLIIQNKLDPLMPSKVIKLFMKVIDKKIVVIEKNRKDHHYPYSKDFLKFFLG